MLSLKLTKGGKVVILDADVYRNKLSNIKVWQRNFNRSLKDHPALIKKILHIFHLCHTRMAYQKHKPGNPLRPIVSSTGSSSYCFSKLLDTSLSPLLGTIYQSHVSNSEDYIGKIKNINLEGKIMASFNVDYLATNVPVDETVKFLRNQIFVY